MKSFQKICSTSVMRCSRYVVCYSRNSFSSNGQAAQAPSLLRSFGTCSQSFLHVTTQEMCAICLCCHFSTHLLSKIVLVLNNSNFHMSHKAHCCLLISFNICHYFVIFSKLVKIPNYSSVFIVHMAYDLDDYSGIWCALVIEICCCEQEVHRSSNMISCKNFEDERIILNSDSCIS